MSERAPGHRRHTLVALLLLGIAAALPILVSPGGRSAGAAVDRCAIPAEFVALSAPLPHTAARLKAGGPLTIVALGSSSTEGIGATRPDRSYPSRLAELLRARFPGVAIRVVNRGVGGELAPQMLARLDRDVLAERPDLVIWQLGTNSVLRDRDPADEVELARRGIERIRAAGADVMLMDLQYAPAVLQHAGYREMEQVLSAVAMSEDVPMVRRFAMMRHWAEDGTMSFRVMLAGDRLHMSDASYDCLARQVSQAIAAAAEAPRLALAASQAVPGR
ncbi:MAG TPA: SGNH/GDSL hydrolase family protein [Stellaceae bacterium]|nr:SGNH/GDSL hydrolase family protein [Stellaceae bacterium]